MELVPYSKKSPVIMFYSAFDKRLKRLVLEGVNIWINSRSPIDPPLGYPLKLTNHAPVGR